MRRTRVRRRRIGLAAVLSVGLAVGLPAAAGVVRAGADPSHPAPGRAYVVAPGDTLWRIATQAEPGRDPREVIAQIERENAVEPGALRPGQMLVLPAPG